MNTLKLSAIALSSALIWGCGSSDDDSVDTNTNQLGTFTNLLEGGYWEFGDVTSVSSDDLPNVYVLENGEFTYYYDDDDLGTYTAYPVSFHDDSAGTFTFDYYDNTITPTETTVYYTIADGVLTIVTDLDELVDYQDYAGDADVIAAIASAGSDDEEETPIVSETSSDGFENYSVGVLISEASSAWSTEKIVDDTTGYTIAEVSDVQASEGDNSLYLEDASDDVKPYAYHVLPGGEQVAGSVSIDVYLDANNSERTFIQVGTGPWDSNRYFQLRLKTALEYEAGDSDVELASLNMDTWHNVEVSWTEEGLFTISLDGEVVGEDIDQATTGLMSSNIPTYLVVYTGSGSGTGNKAYFDNVAFDFPAETGFPIAEVSEDFESYVVGDELPQPWQLYDVDTASSITVISDDATSGNQVMEIYDADDSKPYAVLEFTDYFLEGSASFDLKVASGNTQPCYAAISNDHWNSGRMMEMKVTASGSVYYEAGDNDVKVGTVSLDTWNKFEIIWDNGVFTLKANGVALATDITQEETGLIEVDAGVIKFMAGNLADSGTNCRIDNIASEQL